MERDFVLILKAVEDRSRRLAVPYFIAGGTVRDLMLSHVAGIETGSPGRGLDVAVVVPDWPQFERMKAALLMAGGFCAVLDSMHGLSFQLPGSRHQLHFSLLPFRGITTPEPRRLWPPDMAFVMGEISYPDLLAGAASLTLDAESTVRVAWLPALALSTLLKWSDHGDELLSHRLAVLLHNYADAGNLDRLYEDRCNMLEAVHYDTSLAGARLLGEDIQYLADSETLDHLRALLADSRWRRKLIAQMARHYKNAEPSLDLAAGYFDQLQAGVGFYSIRTGRLKP